jgi:hypothetical protein
MYGSNCIKFKNVQQAEFLDTYENTKLKLHKSKAGIWYTKIYRLEQLTPKYIGIKGNGKNCQSSNTKNAAIRHRLTNAALVVV